MAAVIGLRGADDDPSVIDGFGIGVMAHDVWQQKFLTSSGPQPRLEQASLSDKPNDIA
jgi:hypothetical protein